jgi:hypothetical protein
MVITKEAGLTFSQYGNTSDNLPEKWKRVKFNFRLKKHKLCFKHKLTRIIVKKEGWTGYKKYSKPILSYWTDNLELCERIKNLGDVPNSISFIKETL